MELFWLILCQMDKLFMLNSILFFSTEIKCLRLLLNKYYFILTVFQGWPKEEKIKETNSSITRFFFQLNNWNNIDSIKITQNSTDIWTKNFVYSVQPEKTSTSNFESLGHKLLKISWNYFEPIDEGTNRRTNWRICIKNFV